MPTETIEGFPLSLQQKRLWSFRKAAEQELISEALIAISGPLDRATFDAALRRMIERHEICRSVYKSVPGLPEPVQILEETSELKATGSGKRLEQAPILDWDLQSPGANEHRLTVRFPAVAADATSLRLFMQELCTQYEHAVAGSRDESEPMQYLDYTQWQSDLQDSPEARVSRQFWKNLNSEQAAHTLPLEKTGSGFAVGCETRALNIDSLRALDLFVSQPTGGREAVVCAAWTAFCAKLAELNGEIVMGVYSHGRNFEELQNALGPYDRYLPVHINLREEHSAAVTMQAVRSAIKMAQQHQEFYSGELLGTQSAREGGLAFQFAFTADAKAVSGSGLSYKFIEAKSHAEPFKLKLEFCDGTAPKLRMFYNQRAISAEYASIIAERFEVFLSDFVMRGEARLGDLRFASKRELELVTGRFASSGKAEAKAPTLIDLFQREVPLHPQRPALICDGKVLNYADLNARANQLANTLAKLGVSAGAPVVISAERSFEMIIGLLGIQKAGGAYVPLDPSYPKGRQAQVLEDCGAKVLVAQAHLIAKLPNHRCTMVKIEDTTGESSENLGRSIDPDQAAYIIYTSGSTGQPKGVPITHRKLASSTTARFEYYKEPLANYLLLSSFAFDSSIAGIFWSLAQGGTLTIPREGTHQDPQQLLALIRDYKVSHMLALPSFYQTILEQAVAQDASSLTTVIVAGEACSPELVQRHYAKLPKAQLFNEYGPTEGTVWSTVHRCDPKEQGAVPIGRPVPNMAVYILNEQKQPVAIGQLGEIYISGPTVADGYLHRPDLAAEKFVSASIRGEAKKLYRTGDLGRFREDGLIEFHGRIDEQVKIRGYRIEIGEIEHVLSRHPDVREAVVIAREDAPGDKRLVAYIVAKEQAHVSIPEIRLFAQEKLPQFMVPAQFVSLKTFPLTPNGKIDRKALPAPDDLERGERNFIAPRNHDEEQLAKIWTEVLKLEKVGVEENFFDLGGHSLLAIQVIARVRDSFKLELPMAAFFESPTIGGMAAALSRCREAKGAGTTSIRRVARVAATDEILAKLNGNGG
ncbi:MAG TPA: amino acid adenylation domain-containing protein [Verrucomicrobiae bacterium]